MPTKHQRIPVTKDPELAEALARVARYFDGAPAAKVVHDLAIKGAEALVSEEQRRDEAIGRLIEWSTSEGDNGLDRELLDRVDELAWGYPPRD